MKVTMVRLIACAFGLTIVFGLASGGWPEWLSSSGGKPSPGLQANGNVRRNEPSAPTSTHLQTPTSVRSNLPAPLPRRQADGGASPLDAQDEPSRPPPTPGLSPAELPGDAGTKVSVFAPLGRGAQGSPANVCANSSDCPQGQGCVFDPVRGAMSCQPPDCQRDEDCADNKVCRVASSVGTGASIRRCMQPGTQREGGACHNLSSDKAQMCGAGLLCVKGRCGRPCEENTIGSCPAGSMCVGTINGAACMPTCREGQCPQGQECLTLGDVSLCAASIGKNCRVHGCPEGQTCEVDRRLDTVIFECRARCSPFKPDSCPAGAVCGAGSNGQSVCYRACDFTSHPCPKGYECYTVTEDHQRLGCRRTGP